MATQRWVAFYNMKHSEFVAEIQLKYIPTDIKRRDLGSIRKSREAYDFLHPLYDQDTIGLTEVFIVVFLTGYLEPSKNDKIQTIQLIKALEVFNLELLDHIIVSPEKGAYYSFKDD